MRSPLRFFVILSLLFLYTAYKASQLWPAQRNWAAAASIPFFLIMIGWQMVYRSNPAFFETSWFHAAAWIGGILLGFWATFLLFSIPLDLFNLVTSIIRRFSAGASEERRGFLTHGMRLGVLGLAGGLAGVGLWEAKRGARVREVSVPLPKNSDLAALEGFKIAQISDLHVGPTIRQGYVEEVVRITNETQPDLVVVTGDLSDGTVETIGQHLRPLAELKSRFGTYFVTGNHEYYWEPEKLIPFTQTLGFIPLLNENRVLEISGVSVLLAGVTDSMASPDHKSAARSSRETAYKILLAHRPDACFDAEPLGFHLQISGHTHWGQFFPFSVLMPLAHKYYRGLNNHGRMLVYVNAGTGYWGPPNRFSISPEISLIRLTRST